MTKFILTLSIFFGIYLWSGNSFGQDGHYWNHNYGTTSSLLGGVVIGSVIDMGSIYYNPGQLALSESPSLVLGGNVYQYESILVEDALGNNRDIKDSNLGGVPELLAFSFDIPKLPNHRFAISFLTRRQSAFDILVRPQVLIDNSSFGQGVVLANGEVGINTDVREDWFGLTWSYKVSPNISFGLSNFFTRRKKIDSFNVRFQAIDNDVVVFNRYRDYTIKNIGLLWKAAMSINLFPITAGLIITTPRINISGDGAYLYEDLFAGLDIDGDGTLDNIYASNFQEGIESVFRSPWAVGLGAGVSLRKATVHISAEWYSKVNRYTLLDPEPFYRQSDGELIDIKVVDDLNDVLNYGLGLDYKFKENFSVYASIATDFSAVKESDNNKFLGNEENINNSTSKADFLHFTVGSSFIVKKAEFTIGLGYAYGDQTIPRPVNLPDENNPIFDETAISKVIFSRWKFILGFSIPFLSKSQLLEK